METMTKLGSILLNGTRTNPGTQYQRGQTIGFSEGEDINWILANGLHIRQDVGLAAGGSQIQHRWLAAHSGTYHRTGARYGWQAGPGWIQCHRNPWLPGRIYRLRSSSGVPGSGAKRGTRRCQHQQRVPMGIGSGRDHLCSGGGRLGYGDC